MLILFEVNYDTGNTFHTESDVTGIITYYDKNYNDNKVVIDLSHPNSNLYIKENIERINNSILSYEDRVDEKVYYYEDPKSNNSTNDIMLYTLNPNYNPNAELVDELLSTEQVSKQYIEVKVSPFWNGYFETFNKLSLIHKES